MTLGRGSTYSLEAAWNYLILAYQAMSEDQGAARDQVAEIKRLPSVEERLAALATVVDRVANKRLTLAGGKGLREAIIKMPGA